MAARGKIAEKEYIFPPNMQWAVRSSVSEFTHNRHLYCSRFDSIMSGFDDPGVYYSESFGGGEAPGQDEGGLNRIHIKRRFREFIRQFRVGTDRTGFTYKYRWGDDDKLNNNN